MHDRTDEAVVLASQDTELAAVAHEETIAELELGIGYVAGLHVQRHRPKACNGVTLHPAVRDA